MSSYSQHPLQLRLTHTYMAHSDAIYCLSWYSQHDYLASASQDQTVQVWHILHQPQSHWLTSLPSVSTAVRWHPTHFLLASASEDNYVRLWDGMTGQLLQQGPLHDDLADIVWLQQGRVLALCGYDAHVSYWDTISGEILGDEWVWGEYTPTWAWSPDERHIAVQSTEGRVALLTAQGERLMVFEGHHDQGVHGITWSPDGKWLATAGYDGTVRLWDITTAATVQIFSHAAEPASASMARWSPDGTYIASVGQNALLKLWHARTGNLVAEHRVSDMASVLYDVVWSPNGAMIATAGMKTIHIWNVLGNHE